MKTQILFSLIALTITSHSFAENGEKAGNGGIGYVCRDEKGNLKTVKLLDLVEAENTILGYQLTDEQLEGTQATLTGVDYGYLNAQAYILKRVSPEAPAQIIVDLIQHLKSVSIPQNEDVGIPDPKDFTPKIAETKSCHFEVIGNYIGGALRINAVLYNKMPLLHQTAFWVHESFNFEWKEKKHHLTSNGPRELVAQLFRRGSWLTLEHLMRDDERFGFGLEVICRAIYGSRFFGKKMGYSYPTESYEIEDRENSTLDLMVFGKTYEYKSSTLTLPQEPQSRVTASLNIKNSQEPFILVKFINDVEKVLFEEITSPLPIAKSFVEAFEDRNTMEFPNGLQFSCYYR